MRARCHARGRESRRLSFRAEHARSACEVEESQTVGIEALGRDASRFLDSLRSLGMTALSVRRL
jgi:hypothetical protein